MCTYASHMPLGKTHDKITVLLAIPSFFVAYRYVGHMRLPVVFVLGMLFGGLMFGPDLDIVSKQYARWGIFRFLWWPYRVLVPHRSSLSHGLVLGTVSRLIYFFVMVTLLLAAGMVLYEKYLHAPTSGCELWVAMARVQATVAEVDRKLLTAGILGIWWGAATHSLTDWIVSFLKKY